MGNHKAGRFTLYGGATLQTKERRAMPMCVGIHTDLIQLLIFIAALLVFVMRFSRIN